MDKNHKKQVYLSEKKKEYSCDKPKERPLVKSPSKSNEKDNKEGHRKNSRKKVDYQKTEVKNNIKVLKFKDKQNELFKKKNLPPLPLNYNPKTTTCFYPSKNINNFDKRTTTDNDEEKLKMELYYTKNEIEAINKDLKELNEKYKLLEEDNLTNKIIIEALLENSNKTKSTPKTNDKTQEKENNENKDKDKDKKIIGSTRNLTLETEKTETDILATEEKEREKEKEKENEKEKEKEKEKDEEYKKKKNKIPNIPKLKRPRDLLFCTEIDTNDNGKN